MAPVNWRELRKNLVCSDLSNVAANPKRRKKSSRGGELIEKSVSNSDALVLEPLVSGTLMDTEMIVSNSTTSVSDLLVSSSPLADASLVQSTSIPPLTSTPQVTLMSTAPFVLSGMTSSFSLPQPALFSLGNVEDSIRVTILEFVSSSLTSISHMTPSSVSTSAIMHASSSRLPPLPPPPPPPRVPDFQSRAMSKKLEHTYGRPGMGSLWGLDFKPSDVLGDDFLEECDKQMMEQASVKDNFQSAEVFLLCILGLLRHGASKYEECFATARHTQTTIKKVMVLKESLSKDHAKCVDMIVAFSAAIKSNSTLSEKVDLLLSKFQRMKKQGDDLFDKLIKANAEKKVVKEKLLEDSDHNSKLVEDNSVLQAENTELKKLREENSKLRAENELLKRMQTEKDELIEKVVSRLEQFDVDIQSKFEALNINMNEIDSQINDLQGTVLELRKLTEEKDVELLEARRRVAVEHKKGFEKAVRQTLHFYHEIDLDKFDLFKDVLDGELVNVSELEDEDDDE